LAVETRRDERREERRGETYPEMLTHDVVVGTQGQEGSRCGEMRDREAQELLFL
jgi:hypothetical protein